MTRHSLQCSPDKLRLKNATLSSRKQLTEQENMSGQCLFSVHLHGFSGLRGLHRDHENMSAAADIAVLGPCENTSQYSPWPGQGHKGLQGWSLCDLCIMFINLAAMAGTRENYARSILSYWVGSGIFFQKTTRVPKGWTWGTLSCITWPRGCGSESLPLAAAKPWVRVLWSSCRD